MRRWGMLKKAGTLGLGLTFAGAVLPLEYHRARGNLDPVAAPLTLRTDAIVVFTGEKERIVHGRRLFMQGMAHKLFVTGVDAETPGTLNTKLQYMAQMRPNSVFIDYAAMNTIQNARNTALWVAEQNVKSIRLVTADYHMQRAYFELRRVLPSDVVVYADPLPGIGRTRTMDNEENRLTCRMYETAIGVNFCYGTRKILRDIGLR